MSKSKAEPEPAPPPPPLIDLQVDLAGTVDRVEALNRERVKGRGELWDAKDQRTYSPQARRSWLVRLQPLAPEIRAALMEATAAQLELDQRRAMQLNTLSDADAKKLVQLRCLVPPLNDLVRDTSPAAESELTNDLVPDAVRRRRMSLVAVINALRSLPALPTGDQPDDELKGAAERLAKMFEQRLHAFDEQLLKCTWSECEKLLKPGGIEGPPA